MLAFLKSAYKISEHLELFSEALKFLVEDNDYGKNLINLKVDTPDDNNFSDDELTYLSYLLWI